MLPHRDSPPATESNLRLPRKGDGNSDAAKSQYKPGKGCGDKNHVHEREGECKNPPK